MHIDFAFLDARGVLCLAGWSERAEIAPVLRRGDTGIKARHVLRFRRRDLSRAEDLGFIAAWPRRALLREDEDETALFFEPLPGEAPVGIPRDGIEQGELRLIAEAVDEIFNAYLRAIARRRLAPPSMEASEAAFARVQAEMRTLPAETPVMAVNLDRLMVAPSGIGIGVGWCLTDRRVEQPLLGLASSGRSLRPVHLVTGCMPREDLAGFRERYRYTGRDGFVCAFRVPPSQDADARMLILGNLGRGALVFGRAAEVVSDAEVATALGDLRETLRDPGDEAALMTALAPRGAFCEPDLDAAAQADAAASDGEGDDTLLLLGADVAPWELRDALRRVAAAVAGQIDVIPVGEITAPARQALGAAANEAGARLVIGHAVDTASLATLAPAPGTPVIWGRASAILQLGLPRRLPGRGAVLAHDPVGRIGTEPEPASWARLRGPAAVATVPGALLAAALAAAPSGLLTPDGVIDAALRVLERGGHLEVTRSPVVTFYPGLDGGAAGSGAHAPASLDSELLDLAEQEDLA